jgi:LPXTG-site transpeptidase (sortase) family protein
MLKHKKTSDILQFLRLHWPVCLVFALALSLFCVFALTRPQAEPEVRYEIPTVSGGIDFTAPDIVAHTAGDGIAVVIPAQALGVRPARVISDPAEIWQGETSPTHGGFTLPVAMDGDGIGVLNIPDIGVSVRVYESGDVMEDMEHGAAHFRSTSAWIGNIGVSAHNINLDGTSGYFLNLHTLERGAVIRYQTALGMREYVVDSIREISEWDWSLLERTPDNRITMITCISGRPDMRLAVQAVERFS